MAKKQDNTQTSREKLKSIIERVVRLEEERASLAEDVRDIYREAKSDGFDPKALRKIVKETMQTQSQRAAARETEAIVDLYRASLGMLDGTPLGDAARRRYERELHEVDDDAKKEDAEVAEDRENDAASDDREELREPTQSEARDMGREDHAAGKRIIDNPFQTGSANRAAWDEGFCDADGSDGMDIPKAWRRSANDKPKEAA